MAHAVLRDGLGPALGESGAGRAEQSEDAAQLGFDSLKESVVRQGGNGGIGHAAGETREERLSFGHASGEERGIPDGAEHAEALGTGDEKPKASERARDVFRGVTPG